MAILCNLLFFISLTIRFPLNIIASNDDINLFGCPSSVPTVSEVRRCPRNISEWIKASERKQCSLVIQNCTSQDNFKYHCLINGQTNSVVEVCIPVRRIVGQFCPFYDTKKARAEGHYYLPCKEHRVSCPAYFLSNEAYKYQDCYRTAYETLESNTSKAEYICNDFLKKVDDKLQTNLALLIILIVLLIILGGVSLTCVLLLPDAKRSCFKYFGCCCCKCCKCSYVPEQETEMQEEKPKIPERIPLNPVYGNAKPVNENRRTNKR